MIVNPSELKDITKNQDGFFSISQMTDLFNEYKGRDNKETANVTPAQIVNTTSQAATQTAVQQSVPVTATNSPPTSTKPEETVGMAGVPVPYADPKPTRPMHPHHQTPVQRRQPNAFEYARASIADMEQKMSQLSSLSLGSNNNRGMTPPAQSANASATMTSYTNNITQTTSDHIRNLRADYERLPQWRADMA